MKLAYWMYAGPAHIGTLRVASSFKNVHAIMHAPLGDDYFNVMRSMLERERDFTPVTASIVDRHVLARGSQEKVIENILRKDTEEKPDLILLTPTCTSSILQEDLQNFADRAALESKSDVILADVNHYRVNEIQAADRTLEQVVRFYIEKEKQTRGAPSGPREPRRGSDRDPVSPGRKDHDSVQPSHTSLMFDGSFGSFWAKKTAKPSVNILGIFTLGFHHQHDCRELKRLLFELGIEVNLVIPEGGSVNNLKRLPEAWFNIVPYREIGCMAAQYLEKEFNMPYISITPMGIIETASFIREVETTLNVLSKKMAKEESGGVQLNPSGAPIFPDRQNITCLPSKAVVERSEVAVDRTEQAVSAKSDPELPEGQSGGYGAFNFQSYIEKQTRFVSDAAWFSRSIDCQNLTGKKSVVFGDATHAAAMTKLLAREMGIRVSCAGTYCKHDADWFREQVSAYCDQILITDDHNEVAQVIAMIEPSAIFGTQMERHIGKRLGIPCGVISAPVHIQNFPLGFRPFLGYEGTNQISDLVYNSFSLGMEEKLLLLFSGHDTKVSSDQSVASVGSASGEGQESDQFSWEPDAWKELQSIPSFVRGKVKRNVETFAKEHYAKEYQKDSTLSISLQLLYEAKEKVAKSPK